jgi:hypothetical protein
LASDADRFIFLSYRQASAITPKIGYPLYPNATSPLALQKYYAPQEIKDGDFFGQVLRANSFEVERMWKEVLGDKRNANTWEMFADSEHSPLPTSSFATAAACGRGPLDLNWLCPSLHPAAVNAYFSPPDNEIVFPAGILQPPFFQADRPAYLNYGAFGAVAAHELARSSLPHARSAPRSTSSQTSLYSLQMRLITREVKLRSLLAFWTLLKPEAHSSSLLSLFASFYLSPIRL